MAYLILIRHGQSTYNLENRFTGNVDVGLTSLGEDEAHLAGRKIIKYNFEAAFTSSLKRAQQTLRIILEEINQITTPVIKNAALDERMYGSLQGLNKAETAQKYGEAQVELWRRSFDIRPPDGESLEDTFNRVVPYFKSEIEPLLKKGKNLLIVAHGNSLRALMMYLENIDVKDIPNLNVPTGVPRVYIMDMNLNVLKMTYL